MQRIHNYAEDLEFRLWLKSPIYLINYEFLCRMSDTNALLD